MPTEGTPLLRVVPAAEIGGGGRVAFDASVVEGARAIVERVRAEGDAALVDLTRRFDGVDLGGRIAVSDEELAAAEGELSPDLRAALEAMRERLAALHARQVPGEWWDERDGVRFGETVRPVAAAGAYVPGGRAAYPSTVLMTAVPAKVAGVGRVVLCTPPAEDGSVPAAVRFAASIAGVDAVYRIGGAQAIAALAFGTESVEAVDVVVGPGNVWVTAAKRELAGVVGIDGLAGPTELVVVADGTADPAVLSVDLVAQAEHDPLARVVLVTLDAGLPARVERALRDEVGASPRREIVELSLAGSVAVVAADEDEAAALADRVAPEHLQIVTVDPRRVLDRCTSYGAAFLGPLTPVAFGDYGVGSNHVLPTMATARFSSGLRAADFVRVSSVVEATEHGLERHADEVEAVATAEGLPGHARTVEVRRPIR
ncbi:MAG TPA: histidinol dehydrogenase [Actinomycetota bacterium]|nr:histidinol dehydrogenase [Actinomycetota bacterium]